MSLTPSPLATEKPGGKQIAAASIFKYIQACTHACREGDIKHTHTHTRARTHTDTHTRYTWLQV